MSDCNDILPLLGPFEDGELEPHEKQAVIRHLSGCSSCSDTIIEYAAVRERLRQSSPEVNLAGFPNAVMQKISALPVPWSIKLQRFIPGAEYLQAGRWIPGLTLTSAALALGAWITIIFLPNGPRSLLSGSQARSSISQSENAAAPQPLLPSSEQLAADQDAAAEQSAEEALAGSAIPGNQAIISKLESENPELAVWSEPYGKTTVIWLPDEAPNE